MYWKNKDIVDICSSGKRIFDFAVPSKPEVWAQTADTLFRNGLFGDAAESYQKAHMDHEAAISRAYSLEEEARTLPVGVRQQRTLAFLKAAKAFLGCASGETNSDERIPLLCHAGDCYAEARRHDLAAKAFADASLFTEAISQYRLARMLYDAMGIIRTQKGSIDECITESITETARYVWTKEQKFEYVERQFCLFTISSHIIHVSRLVEFTLFKTAEEQEEYMEDLDFGIPHANFLKRQGKYAEAADLYRREGHALYAITLLLKDSSRENSMRKATEILLESLWFHLSFGVQPDLHSSELSKLFGLLNQLNLDVSHPKVTQEVSVYRVRTSCLYVQLMCLSLKYSEPFMPLIWFRSRSLRTHFVNRERIRQSCCSALIISSTAMYPNWSSILRTM